MAYATKQDMINRFDERTLAQLTDRDNGAADTIDDAVLNGAISDATDFADSFLAKAVSLPLNPVPAILTRVVCEIAYYYLNSTRIDKDSPIYLTYKDNAKWLMDVSKGAVALEEAGSEVKASGDGGVQVTKADRVFTRNSLDVM